VNSRKLTAYGSSFILHLLLLLAYITIFGRAVEHKRVLEVELNLEQWFIEKGVEEKINTTLEDNKEKVIIPPSRAAVRKSSDTFSSTHTPQSSGIYKQEDKVSETLSTLAENKLSDTSSNIYTSQDSGGHKQEDRISGTQREAIPSPSPVGNNQSGEAHQKQETLRSFSNTNPIKNLKEDKVEEKELYLREKLSIISSIDQKSITYPPIARKMGWEGRVLLSITLREDGSLKEVKVLESSGYQVLDKNAVDTVKRVAHLFPKPPAEVIIKLPINYKLE